MAQYLMNLFFFDEQGRVFKAAMIKSEINRKQTKVLRLKKINAGFYKQRITP